MSPPPSHPDRAGSVCPDQGGTEVCDDCHPDCPCYEEKPLEMTQALYLQQQVEIESLRETIRLSRDREWEARIEACALRGRVARQSGEITRLLAKAECDKGGHR